MKKFFGISLIIFVLIVSFFAFSKTTMAQRGFSAGLEGTDCQIEDVYFIPAGEQSNEWFKDAEKPTVKAIIKGNSLCGGKKFYLSIVEEDTGLDDDISGFDDKPFYFSPSGLLEIIFKTGEDECDNAPGSSNDCELYILIHGRGEVPYYSNENEDSKRLYYDCQGLCDQNAEFISTSVGQAKTDWYFAKQIVRNSQGSIVEEQDITGPFKTISECTQNRADYITSTNSNPVNVGTCYFKVTMTVTPPSEANVAPGTSVYEGNYTLLAPIPGLVPNNVVTENFKIGDFVNNLVKVVIGIAAVLAVIMIVIGGVQWMMSDSFLAKGAGKERIKDALLGLGLALGSYLFLYTINPDLLNLNFGLEKITIEAKKDEAGYESYDSDTPSSSSGYKIGGSSFASPTPTSGVSNFVSNLTSGYSLKKIKVNTSSKQATFIAQKSGSADIQVNVPIEIGSRGTSSSGTGVGGDKKTPIGNFKIGSDRRFSTSTSKAVFTRDKKTNLGAMFITIVPNRGIGFHGQKDNLLKKTNGCVRMYNDDLILLAPHMKSGVDVEIS